MGRKLGEQLLAQGVLTEALLTRALERQQATGQKIGECLVRLGLDETPVLRLLAQELKTRFVSTPKLAQAPVDSALLERVPVRLAEGFNFMPLRLDEAAGALYAAMAEPQRQRALEEIARTVGVKQVVPFVAVQRSVRAAIRKHYYSDAQAFAHLGDDEACPHCGAPSAPNDFQCARCELLLVRSPDDLPPRDNVSVVRALLSIPDRAGSRGVPSAPSQDKTRVSSYTQAASGPPVIPAITAGLDLAQKPLNPFEAYILSFVDGRTPLADLALITGLVEVELRAVFESLTERGVTRMAAREEKRAAPSRKAAEARGAPPVPEPVPHPVLVPPPGVAAPRQKAAPAPKPAPSPVDKAMEATENLLQRIVQLERGGRVNEAVELLEKGIAQLPKPAPIYNRLALILLNQQRDYTRATALFRKAADLEPENNVYMMNLYSVLSLEAEATNPGKKVKRK